MFDEEQRAQGRLIARKFIVAEAEDDSKKWIDVDEVLDGDDNGTPEDSDEDDMIEKDGEEDWNPEGHFTDHHFDHETLDWIEKRWGTSMNFVYSCGLKLYEDNDCEMAVYIVKAMTEKKSPGAKSVFCESCGENGWSYLGWWGTCTHAISRCMS